MTRRAIAEEREFMRGENLTAGSFGRTNRLYRVYEDGGVLLNYDDVDTKFTFKADRYEFDGPIARFYKDGEEVGVMRFRSGGEARSGNPQTSWLRVNGPSCVHYDTRLQSGFGYWFWQALKDAKEDDS